jgi:hypothetical protein
MIMIDENKLIISDIEIHKRNSQATVFRDAEHLALDESHSHGRIFWVFPGTGLPDRVRCQKCRREFSANGGHFRDPLAEERNLRDESQALAAVKISYVYGSANDVTPAPTMWFEDIGRALDVFMGNIEEAALAVWSRRDIADTLNSVKIELLQKVTEDWHIMDCRVRHS